MLLRPILLTLLAASSVFAQTPPSSTQLDPEIEAHAEKLLGQMTLEEKVGLLSGTDYMHTAGVPRLGIPALKFSDGPMGVRCWGPSIGYPAGSLLAATWDPSLAQEEGAAIGRDARARGVNIVLGPGVNVYREAQNGRNFEYFGEDPFLASQIAVGYIRGVQAQGVAVCVKHYIANGQEWNRGDVDTIVSRRALEEIYLPPFRAAIQDGGAWTAMAAYNKVNGEWCTANKFLLTDLLRDSIHFKGVLMSDWGAVHDTEKDLNAGTDLEMNGSSRDYYNMKAISPLLRSGAVTQSMIDEHVRRMLRMEIAMGFLDRDQTDKSIPQDDPRNSSTALKVAAEGIVLLKNEQNFLPLDRAKVKHIIVSGPNGQDAVTAGGGSGHVDSFQNVSVLDGVKIIAGVNVQVEYIPDLSQFIFSHAAFSPLDKLSGNEPGLSAEYFNNPDLSGAPVAKRVDHSVDFNWGTNDPLPGIAGASAFSARWTGTIKPIATGDYIFALESDDGSRAFLDDAAIIDMWSPHALMRKEAQVHLEAGRTYRVRAEYFNAKEGAQMHFGWAKPGVPEEEKARIAAADAVVYAGGFNAESEHEGNDRPWEMPASQMDELQQLLAINPHVIATINAGGNLGLGENLAKIPALLWCWYPGENGNLALGKIIFGDINPSGHLPDTFEKKWEDAPAFENYPGDTQGGNHVKLAEGIYVGYRWYDKKKIEPAFPFGFGLSYTGFQFSDAQIKKDFSGVSVTVTNSGTRAGADVVQLYVRPIDSTIDRPVQELKGFSRVELKAGETKRIQIPISLNSFRTWDDAQNGWVVPSGSYQIAIGDSSRHLPQLLSIQQKAQ